MSFVSAFRPILLDLAATIFFLAIFWASGNIFIATGAGIAAGIARVLYLRFCAQSITPLQWLALGLVVVFGGTTLLTHDPHFVMIKPTLVFFSVGAVMLTTNWLGPYLPKLVVEHVSASHILLVSRLWGVLVVALGMGNGAAAFLLAPRMWALYSAAVPIALQIAGVAATWIAFHVLVRRKLRPALGAQAA